MHIISTYRNENAFTHLYLYWRCYMRYSSHHVAGHRLNRMLPDYNMNHTTSQCPGHECFPVQIEHFDHFLPQTQPDKYGSICQMNSYFIHFYFSIIRMWREMMNMSKYMHLCFMTNFSKSKYYRDRNKLETGLSIDSRQVHYHTCRACPKIGLLQSYGVKLTDLLPFFSIKSRTSPRDQLGHS